MPSRPNRKCKLCVRLTELKLLNRTRVLLRRVAKVRYRPTVGWSKKTKCEIKTKAPPKFFTLCTRTAVVKFQNDTATAKLCSISRHNLILGSQAIQWTGIEWQYLHNYLLIYLFTYNWSIARSRPDVACLSTSCSRGDASQGVQPVLRPVERPRHCNIQEV